MRRNADSTGTRVRVAVDPDYDELAPPLKETQEGRNLAIREEYQSY